MHHADIQAAAERFLDEVHTGVSMARARASVQRDLQLEARAMDLVVKHAGRILAGMVGEPNDVLVAEERAGLAMSRLEDLYKRAVSSGDLKVAATVGTYVSKVYNGWLKEAQQVEAERVFTPEEHLEGAIRLLERSQLDGDQASRVRGVLGEASMH